MKNLFDKNCYAEITQRMNALTPNSERLWGKMNVAQMLAHCKEAFKVPLSDHKMPRSILGLLVGWMVKSKLYNDDPWKRNLPTAPNFIIKDERDFEKEKKELTDLMDRFYRGGPAVFHTPCLEGLRRSNGDKACTNILTIILNSLGFRKLPTKPLRAQRNYFVALCLCWNYFSVP